MLFVLSKNNFKNPIARLSATIIMETRPMTLGEKRVQRNFNPSAKKEVEDLKQKYAELIDCLEALKHDGNGRELSIAQTEAETSCMYAVKSLFV